MKVSFVPIEGIVKKVGMKVPNMLPKVCKAPSFPIISPLSFKVVVAYFARLGVVPPSKIRGKTKRMEQVKIDAQIKKFFPPNNITKNDESITMYFTKKGIDEIATPAIIRCIYSTFGFLFLSALFPPKIFPIAMDIIIIAIITVHSI